MKQWMVTFDVKVPVKVRGNTKMDAMEVAWVEILRLGLR